MESEKVIFENTNIDTSQLPGFQGLPTQPIAKSYWYVILIQKLIINAVFISAWTILYFIVEDFAIPIGLIVLGGILLLNTIILIIDYVVFPTRRYLLRQHDISYESGKIFYGMTTLPLNRIQHVSLGQGPLEKIYGLAHLKIYTAGGSQADLTLPGLTRSKAEELKEHLLYQMKNLENTQENV
jgi:hypothetical protein